MLYSLMEGNTFKSMKLFKRSPHEIADSLRIKYEFRRNANSFFNKPYDPTSVSYAAADMLRERIGDDLFKLPSGWKSGGLDYNTDIQRCFNGVDQALIFLEESDPKYKQIAAMGARLCKFSVYNSDGDDVTFITMYSSTTIYGIWRVLYKKSGSRISYAVEPLLFGDTIRPTTFPICPFVITGNVDSDDFLIKFVTDYDD